jgi:predicted pyridoxine 5'-phosphate oxidase superfamily flavin-nucleotide-binding protein
MLFIGEDEKIWVIDNFFDKTLANIKENPEVAIYMWSPEHKGDSYQVKGKATVINSGEEYEKAVFFARAKMEGAPAKNLIKVDVTDIYYVTPGPNAGKKL